MTVAITSRIDPLEEMGLYTVVIVIICLTRLHSDITTQECLLYRRTSFRKGRTHCSLSFHKAPGHSACTRITSLAASDRRRPPVIETDLAKT